MSESNYEKVMRIGKEILLREDAQSLSADITKDALNEATAEMERAAVEGDEVAFLHAKQKKADAQTQLEMLEIRNRNRSEMISMSEAKDILSPYVEESISNMLEEFRTFLSTYDELCAQIERIISAGDQYNRVMKYWKDHVMKVNQFPFRVFMAELFPVPVVLQMKNRSAFDRQRIQEAINRYSGK